LADPMPFEIYLSLVVLAFAAAFTPGPNNALVAASGANFGLRRTLPHVLGIALGFPLMALIVGLALGEAFRQSALLREVVRWGGAALLLWVAWQIARSGGLGRRAGAARPFTFVESAAFQWINPKAWVMAIAITAQFIDPERPWSTALLVVSAFVAAGLVSSLTWAGMGQALARWLSSPARLRVFNAGMGGLIALGVAMMLAESW
jgi:threonine/homoserine/homoserine lactone efflux protein